MKILPISNYHRISNQIKQQNFKGLWGEVHTDSYTDYYIDDRKVTADYYPFQDETQAEIDKVVRDKYVREEYCSDSSKVIDPITTTFSLTVAVISTLPFTSKDFRDYLNNIVSDLKKIVIEKHILEKNLRIKF